MKHGKEIMPHSSGGGCSGGGCHSGGSHSGGSYRPRHRYFYNSLHGVRSILATEEPSESGLRKCKRDLIISMSILLAMTVMLVLYLCSMAKPRNKLPLPADSESIVIDNLNLLSANEKADLLKSCDNFRDKTGIPVEIYLDKHGVISDNEEYFTLQNFAYDEYVKTFKDERHWLIAYAVSNGERFSPDWQFEGMQGDDTDSVLTESLADKFNNELNTNLENGLSVSDSFIKALDHASTYMVGAWNFSGDDCVFAMMFIAFYLVCILAVGLQGYFKISKMKTYIESKQMYSTNGYN